MSKRTEDEGGGVTRRSIRRYVKSGRERRSAATEEMGVGVVGGGAAGGLQAGERELGRRRRGGARTTRSVCSMIADEPRRSPSMVRCALRVHSFERKEWV